jgi:Tol biopolymer transport system component
VIEHSSNRAMVANALLQMGRCYEKLGKQEAQKVYERILVEFADQADPAAQARIRLSNLSAADDKAESAKSARQVWAPAHDIHGRVSPDGRYLSYVNWTKGDLALRDLETGENRDLTDEGTYEEEPSQMADESLWSPDSRQIAYAWSIGKWYDLRIVGIDGSNPRVLYAADPEKGNAPFPRDWSRDGKHILGDLEQGDEDHIVLVSVKDGSVRTLKSLGAQGPGTVMTISPDGRYVVYSLKGDIHILATDGSLDAPLIEHPGLDFWPFWTPDGKRVLFSSDRSGSLGLWLLDVKEGRAQGAPTAIHETRNCSRALGFTQDDSFYYATKNLNKDVYVATLDLEAGAVLSPPTKISLRFEGSNRAPVWSPDGKRLAYFSRRGIWGPDVLVVRSLETGEERDVSLQDGLRPYLDLVFGLPQWSRDGRSIFVGGRTNTGRGAFRIDVETGGVTALRQEKPGDEGYRAWPVFSKDDKTVYLVRGLRLDRLSAIVALDVESGKDVEIYRAAQSVGKLALSPDGRQLAFCEKEKEEKFVLKTMPISGGEPREVFTVPEYRELEWELGLSWTSDGNHLVVAHPKNNKDLWVIPVDGGERRTVKLGAKARGMRLHPDGQRIAFTIGPLYEVGEVWALENFLPDPASPANQLPNPLTGNYFVTRSEDDAEEWGGGNMYLDSSDLELMHDSNRRGDQVVGVRFANMRIPKGTQIKKVYVQFTTDEVTTRPTDLSIHAELVKNAKAFTTDKHNISSRKRTEASVKWSPEPWKVKGQRSANQRTPDLSSLIQEVIDQPDWQEGNAIVLIFTGSGQRNAISFDNRGRQYSPMLYIEY